MAQPNDLKDFSLPSKTWGSSKRHLRCINTAPWNVGFDHEYESDVGKPNPSPPLHESFDQIRKKLRAHLRLAADELNLTAPPPPDEPDDNDEIHVEEPTLPPVPRRPRRNATKPPRRDPSPSPPPPPPPTTTTTTRSSRARSLAERAEKKRRKFTATLSRDEIDEDFYALTGRKAPGRPKRRPPAVRKQVDMLLPGLCLSEITASRYVVAPPRARSRGG